LRVCLTHCPATDDKPARTELIDLDTGSVIRAPEEIKFHFKKGGESQLYIRSEGPGNAVDLLFTSTADPSPRFASSPEHNGDLTYGVRRN
jgi:hypothetical protein